MLHTLCRKTPLNTLGRPSAVPMVSGPPALVLHAKRFAATGRLSSLWLVFQVWAFSVSLSTRERFTVGAELRGDILASEARRGLFVSHVRPKENGEQVQIESRRQARCGRSHPLEGVRLRQKSFRGRLLKIKPRRACFHLSASSPLEATIHAFCAAAPTRTRQSVECVTHKRDQRTWKVAVREPSCQRLSACWT